MVPASPAFRVILGAVSTDRVADPVAAFSTARSTARDDRAIRVWSPEGMASP